MIFDVTDHDFQERVVDRSSQVPVVVDFWAAWCAPCRQLTPVLERAVTERGGAVELAKLDTDANPGTSAAFRIQGIPAVKAFRDGRVVAEFVGAQPPQRVAAFLDALVPTEAERLARSTDEGDLRRALDLDPARTEAAVALARILAERGEREEALRVLEGRPGFAAQGLRARIELEDEPGLAEAFAELDGGELQAGLDALLAAIAAADDAGRKETLRQAIVGVLDELGVEHPLARDARRRLAAALY